MENVDKGTGEGSLVPAKRCCSQNPLRQSTISLIPEAQVMNTQGPANKTVSGSLKAVLSHVVGLFVS